jgi:hypothetical protein
VSKLRKVDVPCVSSCILNDCTGVMNARKQLNLSRMMAKNSKGFEYKNEQRHNSFRFLSLE